MSGVVCLDFYLLDYYDDGLIADVVVDVEMRLPTMAFCLVVVCFCQFGVFACVIHPRIVADVYIC